MTAEIPPLNITARNTRIIPIEFAYYEPRTIDEALEILEEYGDSARVLAGGTDLLVKIKTRQIEPRVIVNIKKINSLRYIIDEGEYIRIGCLTRIRDLERSGIIARYIPALHDAAKQMASVQIRNMATIGGNLCNASPAADTAPPLLVHNARAVLINRSGQRIVPLEEFFVAPGKTALRPGELLVEIVVEKTNRGSSAFKKIGRVELDLAIASTAVYIEVEDDEITEARLALGSVAPRPIRAKTTEQVLKGMRINEADLRRALSGLEREVSPITDARSTAEYRRYIVKILAYDSLMKAYERIRRGD